jgi:hypothetical protein
MAISVADYQRRLARVTKITVLRELVNEEIIKEESTLKMLKEQDFLEGDIYGDNSLVSYRSKNYELFKSKHNPKAGGAVDLILTGAFVDAMYLLKSNKGVYKFGNKDKKRKLLQEKYGDVFGLNQEVFNKFQKEIIAPRFLNKIKQYAKI